MPAIIILLFSTFLFTFSAGINAVSFPLILYQHQVSPVLIGVIEGVEILAGVLIAKFLYGLSHKIGALRMILIFAVIEAAMILILPLHYSFWWWIFLVLISGLSWFIIIALRQSWINISTTNNRRSMILALNSTMICAGFALGPIAVKLIGAGQYLVFIISAILVLISCFSLLVIRKHQPKLDAEKADYWQIIKTHKSGFIARFLLDLQIVVIILFTVIYGLKNGLSAENSGILVSAFMTVGLADFFIGWMINNKELQKYINFGFLGALLAIAFLPWAIGNYYLAIGVYVIYGWFISLIFISVITKVNHNQNKKDLIVINSALQAVGGLGALCGTLLVGIFMQIFDAQGFVMLIVLANLVYFLILGIPARRGAPSGA
ncbi:MAG: MFS transporter [Pseudomonadota bacterium]